METIEADGMVFTDIIHSDGATTGKGSDNNRYILTADGASAASLWHIVGPVSGGGGGGGASSSGGAGASLEAVLHAPATVTEQLTTLSTMNNGEDDTLKTQIESIKTRLRPLVPSGLNLDRNENESFTEQLARLDRLYTRISQARVSTTAPDPSGPPGLPVRRSVYFRTILFDALAGDPDVRKARAEAIERFLLKCGSGERMTELRAAMAGIKFSPQISKSVQMATDLLELLEKQGDEKEFTKYGGRGEFNKIAKEIRAACSDDMRLSDERYRLITGELQVACVAAKTLMDEENSTRDPLILSHRTKSYFDKDKTVPICCTLLETTAKLIIVEEQRRQSSNALILQLERIEPDFVKIFKVSIWGGMFNKWESKNLPAFFARAKSIKSASSWGGVVSTPVIQDASDYSIINGLIDYAADEHTEDLVQELHRYAMMEPGSELLYTRPGIELENLNGFIDKVRKQRYAVLSAGSAAKFTTGFPAFAGTTAIKGVPLGTAASAFGAAGGAGVKSSPPSYPSSGAFSSSSSQSSAAPSSSAGGGGQTTIGAYFPSTKLSSTAASSSGGKAAAPSSAGPSTLKRKGGAGSSSNVSSGLEAGGGGASSANAGANFASSAPPPSKRGRGAVNLSSSSPSTSNSSASGNEGNEGINMSGKLQGGGARRTRYRKNRRSQKKVRKVKKQVRKTRHHKKRSTRRR